MDEMKKLNARIARLDRIIAKAQGYRRQVAIYQRVLAYNLRNRVSA